jgi:hypothetical protein
MQHFVNRGEELDSGVNDFNRPAGLYFYTTWNMVHPDISTNYE